MGVVYTTDTRAGDPVEQLAVYGPYSPEVHSVQFSEWDAAPAIELTETVLAVTVDLSSRYN